MFTGTTVIGERPGDSLESLMDDYAKVTRNRAPGLLHAIARFGKEPETWIEATKFLARIGSEATIVEPHPVLRREAIHLIVRHSIGRAVSDPQLRIALHEEIVRFFASHPEHFWQCLVNQHDALPVQRFLQEFSKSYQESKLRTPGGLRSLPMRVFIDALINCRMELELDMRERLAILPLYKRVVAGIISNHDVLRPEQNTWKHLFCSGAFVLTPKTTDTIEVISHTTELAGICDFARGLARAHDVQQAWEANMLLKLVMKMHTWNWMLDGQQRKA